MTLLRVSLSWFRVSICYALCCYFMSLSSIAFIIISSLAWRGETIAALWFSLNCVNVVQWARTVRDKRASFYVDFLLLCSVCRRSLFNLLVRFFWILLMQQRITVKIKSSGPLESLWMQRINHSSHTDVILRPRIESTKSRMTNGLSFRA